MAPKNYQLSQVTQLDIRAFFDFLHLDLAVMRWPHYCSTGSDSQILSTGSKSFEIGLRCCHCPGSFLTKTASESSHCRLFDLQVEFVSSHEKKHWLRKVDFRGGLLEVFAIQVRLWFENVTFMLFKCSNCYYLCLRRVSLFAKETTMIIGVSEGKTPFPYAFNKDSKCLFRLQKLTNYY